MYNYGFGRGEKNNKAWAPLKEKEQDNISSKKKDFFKALTETYNQVYKLDEISKYSLTENGALVYATTGNAILDMNFSITQYRGKDKENQIKEDFRKAFNENPLLAIKWLFYCRDIREGVGERNLFRVCMNDLANNGQEELVNALIPVIAEYGRWDDLYCLLGTKCERKVFECISNTIKEDMKEW